MYTAGSYSGLQKQKSSESYRCVNGFTHLHQNRFSEYRTKPHDRAPKSSDSQMQTFCVKTQSRNFAPSPRRRSTARIWAHRLGPLALGPAILSPPLRQHMPASHLGTESHAELGGLGGRRENRRVPIFCSVFHVIFLVANLFSECPWVMLGEHSGNLPKCTRSWNFGMTNIGCCSQEFVLPERCPFKLIQAQLTHPSHPLRTPLLGGASAPRAQLGVGPELLRALDGLLQPQRAEADATRAFSPPSLNGMRL